VVNADGTGLRTLPRLPGDELEPVWSPDGTRIAFIGDPGGVSFDLYVVNADGTGLRLVLATAIADERDPAWSPDGRRIVFSADFAGTRAIWQVDSDGNHLRRLTTGAGPDRQPVYSPDGSHIAFVRGAPANG
jgi:Tol biopolymer transport system component